MNDTDKKDFASIMRVTWQSFKRNEPDKDTMRYWFEKLSSHDIKQVGNAFDMWITQSKELPTFKDIADLLKPKKPDYKALPKPKISDEKLNEIHDKLSAFTTQKRDMKEWARKIIANQKAYPEISLKFAKEALEIKE